MFCHHRLCQWFRLSDFWDDVISLSLFFVFVSTSVSDLRWNFWVYISPPSRTRTWNKHRCRSLSQDWKKRWVKAQNLLIDQDRDSEQKYSCKKEIDSFKPCKGSCCVWRASHCWGHHEVAWRQELGLGGRFLTIKTIRGGCKKLSTIYSGCKISAKMYSLLDFPSLSTMVAKIYWKKHPVRCPRIISHGCKEIQIKKNTQCWIFHHYQPGLLKLDNTKRSLLNCSLVLIMDAKKYKSRKTQQQN